MPNESISVYFSVQDGGSRVLKQIADQTKVLDKETQELQQAMQGLEAANKNLLKRQGELQSQMKSANKTVNEAQKAFDEYGDEVSKLRLDNAIDAQAKLKSELVDVNAQLQGNTKTYKEYLEAIRKGGNDSGVDAGIASMGKKLAASGVLQQLSGAASEYIQVNFASAMGMPAATQISDLLGGTISGIAAGAVAGPLGMLIGGGVGAFSGLLTSQTKIMEAQDDAFKDYYKALNDEANARTEASITSGSAIAGSREKDKISFSTLFGSEEKADDYLKSMVTMANTTPFLYDDLKDMSKTLATYGWDETGILPVLSKIGDAGAALGMATSDMSAVATALGRMKSSDKASLEYLNILNDRGIGAVGYLAEARGVSVGDMYTQISKGQISGTEAADILLEALERDFAGSMLAQSRTFEGLSSTREGLMQEIDNAGGEGYNTIRNQGLQEDIDAYGGRLGDALQSLAEVEGQTRAMMENLQERYQREALSAVTLGSRYADMELFPPEQQEQLKELANEFRFARAEWNQSMEQTGEGNLEAGARMEALKEQAESLARAAFDSSEESKTLQEVTLDQIAATRDSIAAMGSLEGALHSYNVSQEESKGMGAQRLAELGSQDLPLQKANYWTELKRLGAGEFGAGYAVGLDRVPYDNFPALLHEGERVLTAQQVREADRSDGGGDIHITVNVDGSGGDGEELADQIADIIVQRLELARMRG